MKEFLGMPVPKVCGALEGQDVNSCIRCANPMI